MYHVAIIVKKDVLIKISDAQTVDGQTESMEITTKGIYDGSPENYRLEFTECFDEEIECTTELFVKEKQCVTMIRRGFYNSELIIEKKKRHNCHYATPHGVFMIGIYAMEVDSDINTEGCGTLKMNYTIDYYSGLAAVNNMTITASVLP